MKQQGTTKILIILLVVLAIVAGIYWWSQKQSVTSPVGNVAPKSANTDIQNVNDLTSTANDLDSSDVDKSIDPELDQNQSDAASF